MATCTFPATRGIQAGQEFYTASIPFRYLVRLFMFDDEALPPQLRAQRKLEEHRARKISQYIIDNPQTFVLPAITASVDSSMTFEAMGIAGADADIGKLHIPLDANLLINDGQHRRRGIELAIRESPELANESISVTLFYDRNLKHSQQMFADINGTAKTPSKSLSALYDARNPFSRWAIDVLEQNPLYKARIDLELANPAKNSSKLWSLVAFRKFISLLTGVTEGNFSRQDDIEAKSAFVKEFLNGLNNLPLWESMMKGHIPAPEAREEYILAQTVFLHALGRFGNVLGNNLSALKGLADIDPSKTALVWRDRCVVQGKMRKNTQGEKTTTAVLMRACGVDMPKDIFEADALIQA